MDTPASTPENPPSRPASSGGSLFRAFQTVLSVAILIATLFTLWTPASLFTNSLTEKVNLAFEPLPAENSVAGPTPTPVNSPRIGIVAGHWGNDSGAVCQDGLTEVDVNLKIATLVKQTLTAEGYVVDLLQEFDHQLLGYQAMMLLSIHNDSCDYVNDDATGFKVSAAKSNVYPEKAVRLTNCLIDRYGAATRMRFHFNSITPDMTEYHAFEEINTNTIAAIIETGFLNLDRQILTESPELIARGVTDGILCYMRNENVTNTPVPDAQ